MFACLCAGLGRLLCRTELKVKENVRGSIDKMEWLCRGRSGNGACEWGRLPWKGSKVGAAGREKLGWWAEGVLIYAGSHRDRRTTSSG